MGSCPLAPNIFYCSKNSNKKKSNIDIDLLKEEKDYIYESDNYINKKYSNIAKKLKVGRLKNRTKTDKKNLDDNELDDSDHIVQIRPKINNRKKKKRKLSMSNKLIWKRGHTFRLRKKVSAQKLLKRRSKRRLKNSLKKTYKNYSYNSSKNEEADKEMNIKKINTNVIGNKNNIKINYENDNRQIINNNIVNNNIINNINININENKNINNGINISVDLNNNKINGIGYKKGKTSVNKYLKKETNEEMGNGVYIKIISEKSIDYSHKDMGQPNRYMSISKSNTKLINPNNIKFNNMESNIKITIDNLNHSKTVNYNKLNNVNTSSNNSNEGFFSMGLTKKSFNIKSERFNKLNKFNMTGTGNNSSESLESDSSEAKIKLFEKLEKEEEEFIKDILKKNKKLINEFDDDAIDQFSKGFYCVEFQKGQILFKEGNEAKIFYIMFSGKVLIYDEDNNNENDKNKNIKINNKINNFILEDNKDINTNPFSTLNPKTIIDGNLEINNDNVYNNKNIKNHTFTKPKKSDTVSGKISLNTAKTSKELVKGCCFGQECFKENGVRTQNAKVIEKSKIFCCSGEFYRNAKNYMLLKIAKERMEILHKLPLFKYCDENKLISLSKKLKESKYNYCSIIINENEMCNTIYVIKEGEIRITKKFKKLSSLQKGSYFGYINLIIKKANSYTYSVESKNAILYEIPYSFFMDNLNDNIYKIFIHAIKTSIRIKQLFIHNYKYFYKIFKLKYYQDGEIVYKKSLDQNKKLCVIMSGKLKKEKENKIVANEEEVFGDNIIDSREDLADEIISLGESLIFEASWNNIVSASEVDKHNNLDIFETVRNLKRVKILNNIHEIEILELAKVANREKYKDMSVISKEGELANKFYIVKKGKVKLYQKLKFIREIDLWGFFGLIPGITGVVKLFTAFAAGETECYVINKNNFPIIEPSIKESIKDYGYLDDLNIELKDLFIVKGLGKGKFGKVYLVHNRKHFYAIKVATLSEILKIDKIKYYLKEKEIMKMLDFPFVLRLVKTLKTNNHIFFLEEHIEGMSLRNYLSNRKKENNKNIHEAEFYGAILLLVLNYIHNKRIIHRDIKPDNCMIDQKGYLKVIDFGISKYLKDEDFTNTICGTPHYMAPEIISGKVYSFSADYWSFGITLFEIFYDYLPFGQGAREILDIYQQILGKKLILPYDPKFNDFNSFLKLILSRNIMHRVCNYQLLKSHPFFQGFQFENLINHSIKPPFVPDISNDNKNMSIRNCSVLDYFQKDIKNSKVNEFENTKEYKEIKQLLEDF